MDSISLAYVLIGLGLLLMLAELLVPTGFILLLGGVAAVIGGIVLTFVYGDARTGMLTLVCVAVAMPIFGGLMFYLWPRTPMGKRFVTPPDNATVATMPVVAELEQYRGRIGKTVSPMRPAGAVEFDGRRVDCITEGTMIDANQWVKCIEVKTGRVIVRRIEKPSLKDLESGDFKLPGPQTG